MTDNCIKPVFCVDIDNTVFPLIESLLPLYCQDKRQIRFNEFVQYDLMNVLGEFGDSRRDFFKYFDDIDILNIRPYHRAYEAMKWLHENGTLYFCTAAIPETIEKRHLWLKKWFDGIYKSKMLIRAQDKGLIQCDFIFDDYIKNIEDSNGYGFVFDMPWNQCGYSTPSTRLYGWDGAIPVIDKTVEIVFYRTYDEGIKDEEEAAMLRNEQYKQNFWYRIITGGGLK